jgi:hypothetical protein
MEVNIQTGAMTYEHFNPHSVLSIEWITTWKGPNACFGIAAKAKISAPIRNSNSDYPAGIQIFNNSATSAPFS